MFEKIKQWIMKIKYHPMIAQPLNLGHPCRICEFSLTGIPCGRCTHPKAGFKLLPDRYWFDDKPDDCPLNKLEDNKDDQI
jgi:hypothetical protein